MKREELDELIQKFLNGETTRDDEIKLINQLLRLYNEYLRIVRFYREMVG